MRKDLLSIYALEPAEIDQIFERTRRLKRMLQEGQPHASLPGKVLGMIFDKPSTRTRLSFEVGMYQLGGLAIFLSSRDIQIGRGETIPDTARIMSRYLNAIMIRTFSQGAVEELARHASIPVINGLTDLLHPCQVLTDIFTVIERKGSMEGLKVAFIGDGNNVAHSWINAATRIPFHLALACPEGYDPAPEILARGEAEGMAGVRLYRDPTLAAREADVIYTDVWTSMGQEAETERRAAALGPYQVNRALLAHARPDVLVMHCLPAHRGEEITTEVMDGPHSIVFDQAENRLHVQKAILEILMKG